MKRSVIFILAIATLALSVVRCGKAPPGQMMGQNGGGPTQMVTLVGKTYVLTEMQNRFGAPTPVPPNSLTLTLQSDNQVNGSFGCYMGNTMTVTAQYLAMAAWNQGVVTFTNVNSTIQGCLPNHFFNLQSSLRYQFSNNGLTLTDFNGDTADFSLQP